MITVQLMNCSFLHLNNLKSKKLAICGQLHEHLIALLKSEESVYGDSAPKISGQVSEAKRFGIAQTT